MKETIGLSQFRDAFQIRKENFSYRGLEALFNYLEEYEESTGDEIELDVIGLCCEYTEYKNLVEFQNDYDADDFKTMEDIENTTTVIMIDEEAFIIQCF